MRRTKNSKKSRLKESQLKQLQKTVVSCLKEAKTSVDEERSYTSLDLLTEVEKKFEVFCNENAVLLAKLDKNNPESIKPIEKKKLFEDIKKLKKVIAPLSEKIKVAFFSFLAALIGAVIGTAVCPGVGTAIGAATGLTVSFFIKTTPSWEIEINEYLQKLKDEIDAAEKQSANSVINGGKIQNFTLAQT